MKRLLTTLFLVVTTITIFAQSANDNTLKFLGHPVDGSKAKMAAHLKKRGFTYNEYLDCHKGKFNGKQVEVFISTTNDKIDRIYVSFPKTSESDIRYEYNNLISQFNKNEKYMFLYENKEIPEKEDISYEMSVNNKRYEASFYLKPQIDTLAYQQQIKEEITAKYTEEELKELSEADIMSFLLNKILDTLTGNVWFTIHETYGRYNIGLYYDNLKNRPNGEDL